MSHKDNANTAFLPGNRKPDIFILAQTPYTREDLASISGGANPAQFKRFDPSIASWGLLYIDGNSVGFYVPASESPMATLMRSATGSRPEPVYLRFEAEYLVSVADSSSSKGQKGILTAIADFFEFSARKVRFVVSWKIGTEDIAKIDFFASGKERTFSEAIARLPCFRTECE